MKQIYIFLAWCSSALAIIDSRDRGWRNSLLMPALHARSTHKDNLLVSRSPGNQPSRSSSPMQRAQNIPSSARPRRTSSDRHQDNPVSSSQSVAQSSATPQGPWDSLNWSSHKPMTPGSPRRKSGTPGRPQVHGSPSNKHKNQIRGAVLGPAIINMPGPTGAMDGEYVPWGRGELIRSQSNENKLQVSVNTLEDHQGRLGDAFLSAQGQKAVKMRVEVGPKAGGEITQKAPSPKEPRRIPQGQTDSVTLRANPPPQHQHVDGWVKGEGKIEAMASSPGPEE